MRIFVYAEMNVKVYLKKCLDLGITGVQAFSFELRFNVIVLSVSSEDVSAPARRKLSGLVTFFFHFLANSHKKRKIVLKAEDLNLVCP